MKLEVGKTYITRNGRIVDITDFGGKYYLGKSQDEKRYIEYTSLGEVVIGVESPEDIVALAPEPPTASKAATDKVGTGLTLIPLYSLLNLGKIFIEGLRYGRDNWKKGVNDKEYQEERLEHALLHLIKYKEGDRSEEHLAKVAWFCFTQLELERLENVPSVLP